MIIQRWMNHNCAKCKKLMVMSFEVMQLSIDTGPSRKASCEHNCQMITGARQTIACSNCGHRWRNNWGRIQDIDYKTWTEEDDGKEI